jgi:hypothetical protein
MRIVLLSIALVLCQGIEVLGEERDRFTQLDHNADGRLSARKSLRCRASRA